MKLRQLSSAVVHEGTAQGAGANNNQIQLDLAASAVDGAYDPSLICIIDGTGSGQTRLILEYNGSTRIATVDRDWKVQPDNTSTFVISGHPGREHTNEGLAQGGGADTITLNQLASANDDEYVGMVISIRSGTGQDQACRIIAYNGTTKVAQIARNWNVQPDTTSAYVILPTSVLDLARYSGIIADAVWDESTNDHTLSGSYGYELATKSDILASTATDYEQTDSAVITAGVDNSGTYSDTASRDGVYWEIGEDVSTGLTVDFTFYLPSADHKPGVFRVFGRYTGSPATTHHQELWFWNTEATAWEELADDFMPGGITTDDTFEHEYYERHIDRSDSNKVMVRIKHHPTTFNPSHALHLDYVGLSSIKVLTAAEIAAAVWAAIAEGSFTQGDLMKLISAALAGKLSGAPSGPIVIRDINDSKDRITATVDTNGNRSEVVLDVSS